MMVTINYMIYPITIVRYFQETMYVDVDSLRCVQISALAAWTEHGQSLQVMMKPDYERSSGNVFADLGFRNSKQELLKAALTVEIYKLLKARGVTQQEAAKLLGTTQAQVSALMRCKPVSVSVGRLMEFLTMLGQDVNVTVKPAPRRRKAGDMSVVVQHV
jgi:predicted XRE-type DNA-binding protein